MSWLKRLRGNTAIDSSGHGVRGLGGILATAAGSHVDSETADRLARFFATACFLSYVERARVRRYECTHHQLLRLVDEAWSRSGIVPERLSADFSYTHLRARALADESLVASIMSAATVDVDLRSQLLSAAWRLFMDDGVIDPQAVDTMAVVGAELGLTRADIEAAAVPFVRSVHASGSDARAELYRRLDLEPDADEAQVRQAFRKLSHRYHPDKHREADAVLVQLAERQFKRIREAYEILTTSADATSGSFHGLNDNGQLSRGNGAVRCFLCNAVNRVEPGHAAKARCTLCEAYLCFDRETADGLRVRWLSRFGSSESLSGNEPAAESSALKAMQLFERGAALVKQERYGQAIDVLREAVSLDSCLTAGHFDLGVALGRLGKHVEAVASFRRVVELEPEHATAQLNLGLSFAHLEDYNAALPPLREAIRLVPSHDTAHVTMAHALWKLEQAEEAIRALEHGLRINANNVSALRLLGRLYTQEKRYPEAVDQLRRATQLDATDATTFTELGVCYAEMGRDADVGKVLEDARNLGNRDIDVTMRLANAYLSTDRSDEAVSLFAEVLKADPEHGSAMFGLGLAYASMHRHDDVVDIMGRYIRDGEGDPEAFAILASAHAEAGRLEMACDAARQAVAMDNHHGEAWSLLGGCLVRLGRIQDAVEALEHATALLPAVGSNHHHLGCCYQLLDRWGDAAGSFKRAAECDSSSVDTWYRLAVSLHKDGDLHAALNAATRVAELEPEHIAAHELTGRLHLATGDAMAAVASMERVTLLDERRSSGWFNLGLTHWQAGQLERAVNAARRGVELSPEDGDGHRQLGRLYEAMRRYEDAAHALTEAIRLNPNDAEAHLWLSLVFAKLAPSEAPLADEASTVDSTA